MGSYIAGLVWASMYNNSGYKYGVMHLRRDITGIFPVYFSAPRAATAQQCATPVCIATSF